MVNPFLLLKSLVLAQDESFEKFLLRSKFIIHLSATQALASY
jgi:hypothetical protein